MLQQNNSVSKNRSAEQLTAIYCSALDSIFCSIVILDDKGDIVYTNPSMTRLLNKLNVSLEALMEMALEQVNLTESQGFYQMNLRDIRVNISVYPLITDNVRFGSTLVIHESLNENCRLPELYNAVNKLDNLNAFLECSHDGIMVADEHGTMLQVNSAYEQMVRRSRKDLIGYSVQKMLDEGVYSESVTQMVLKSQKTEMVVLHLSDREWVATGTPVFSKTGELSAVFVNLRDVTELNSVIREMNRQKLLVEGYIREINQSNNRQETTEMIAQSKSMQSILDKVYLIADVSSTVLITGETGTGKEVLARQIFNASERRDKPFIKINCAAIPKALFESELFGYEEGAFTGARRKGKAGYFELANGGTLLLDEISEMPLELQGKLLRVLQENEITRVGGTESIKLDVRIIAATNKDIRKMAQEGSFRQDLFYRLNVVDFYIPPLRQRRDDIIPLAMYLLECCNKKYNRQKVLSQSLAKILRSLDWPGNVRELENCIENMIVLTREDLLTPEDLPEYYCNNLSEENQIIVNGVMPLEEAKQFVERQLLRNAAQQYTSASQIAQALGVDRTTVSRKLKRMRADEQLSTNDAL